LSVNKKLLTKISNLNALLTSIKDIDFVYDKNKLKVKGLDSSIQDISTILNALSELSVDKNLSTLF
jgi:hypothetical protein